MALHLYSCISEKMKNSITIGHNNNIFNNRSMRNLFFLLSIFITSNLFAQEGTAKIKLTFEGDSVKTCFAKVTADTTILEGKGVKFFVKRTFSLLPIGKTASTNEEGVAEITFPNDLPGDESGNLIVIAKVEDDDDYGTFQSEEKTVAWGVKPNLEKDHWGERALYANRGRAPIYLIIASLTIIAGVWGTLFYIVSLIVKIKKNEPISK